MAKTRTESALDAVNRKFIEENLSELKKRKSVRYMLRATIKQNPLSQFFCILFFYGIYIPVFAVLNRVAFGLRVEGRKHLKGIQKGGYVSVCNHVHTLDNTFCARANLFKRTVFTSIYSNFEMRGAGIFLRLLSVVPTPENFVETRVFLYGLGQLLKRGRVVHFYPEGELVSYCDTLRPFQNGAFHLAIAEQKPIVPMRIVYRPRKNPAKKPRMTLVVGAPIYPQGEAVDAQNIQSLKAAVENAMQEMAGNQNTTKE